MPGATTKDLDQVAAKVLADHGAKPNFLGYGGFPGNICTSVNDVVVHGIPGKETVLEAGDLLSIDAGAIIDGWHGDAALTVFVGEGHSAELHELSRVTEESMWAGIAAMRKGNRLVDISKAVERYSAAAAPGAAASTGSSRTTAVTGSAPDARGPPPAELRRAAARQGAEAGAGMCLAIEPMVSLGTPRTHVLADDWTVETNDGTWSSHWEHSVALTEQGPWCSPRSTVAGQLAELGIKAARIRWAD